MKKEIRDRFDDLDLRLSKLEQGEPECSCPPDITECPEHGQRIWVKPETMFKHDKPAPEPPLHVRVAQALGKELKYIWKYNFDEKEYYWAIKKENGYECVPRYDESVELAVDALEGYWQKNKHLSIGIHFCSHGLKPVVTICQSEPPFNVWKDADTLPLAICEAIDKHHKAAK